jgi:hypothetical protein
MRNFLTARPSVLNIFDTARKQYDFDKNYTDRDPVTPTGEMWLLPSSHWLTVLLLLIGHTAQHQNKGRRCIY